MSRDLDLLTHADGLFVLETTDGEAWLGQLSCIDGAVIVHSGFVGRPPQIPVAEVLAVTPAAEHPDVFIPRQMNQR
jgi:hypothetical protein